MPPAMLGVPYDLHPCERPWRRRLIARITSGAGHSGTTALARIVSVPGATWMVLTNPETTLASGALHLTIRYFFAAFGRSTTDLGLSRFNIRSTAILACICPRNDSPGLPKFFNRRLLRSVHSRSPKPSREYCVFEFALRLRTINRIRRTFCFPIRGGT
jgi:hypothetical protein